MSSYKTDQHHLVHRGREFHFVSYEACLANPRTGEAAMPATWYLMSAGKRWPVFAQLPDQDPEMVIAALTQWLDRNVFAARLA
jgi:hypothetical protein